MQAPALEPGVSDSQILQDVLTRLDRAFQRFFARVKEGETQGYPRFHGKNRYHSFTYKQFGNGAREYDRQ
jgi:putative transposase